jgi:hypothetical protein
MAQAPGSGCVTIGKLKEISKGVLSKVKTYFVATRVTPLPDNPLQEKIDEAMVYFWVVDSVPENAMERANSYLTSYRWKLESVDTPATEVTTIDFADHEDGLRNFWKAKQKGFAAQFVGKPKSAGPMPEKA